MREQLRQEVLRRFAGAPDTQQARDLRDEILSNTLQRYDDLLAEGRSEQEAYASALESIGDVEELLSSLPRAAQAEQVREAQPKAEAPKKEPRSRGMRIACAIVWPCTALLAVVIGWYGSWGYAWAVFPFAAAVLHVAESVILLARGRRAARGRSAAAVHLRALCRPDGCNGQVDRDLACVSDGRGARRRAERRADSGGGCIR